MESSSHMRLNRGTRLAMSTVEKVAMHTPRLRIRLISLFLNVAVLFSIAVPAYAATPSAPIADDTIYLPSVSQDSEDNTCPTPTPVPPEERVELATTHIAEPTGIKPPSRYGPSVNDPEQGIPRHAYSPFDDPPKSSPCPPGGCEVVANQLAVKLSPQAVRAQRAQVNASAVSAAMVDVGITSMTPIFPQVEPVVEGAMIESFDGDPMPKPDLAAWYLVELNEVTAADITSAVDSVSELESVAYAEPVYLRRPTGMPSESAAPAIPQTVDEQVEAADLSFNDPLYAQQWHLEAANVPAAWQWLDDNHLPPGGSRDIVVAVIDTGVDYTHPDLAANMWVNSQEIAGNGVDDDGNGFIDDVHGANVVSNQHSGDPQDDHGHGTHVAGIVAAQANNGIGGVGVAYNTQIMAIKAAQYSGVLATTDIAEAIYYAVAHGADVINMSFGGYTRSQVEEDALAIAFGQAVLVAAAGNDGYPTEIRCNVPYKPMYPAAHNWVLGVMASNVGGSKAEFSNYDTCEHSAIEYEVMAPGVDLWSSLPQSQYSAWDGTSMSSPVAAGIAALARTYWSNKDIYSSRFIMGQISANASPVVDGLASLTIPPQPELSYLEHWLFDTAEQDPVNDDDGIVDAGETVELAIVIRNHWGKAENVQVTLQPLADGAVLPDPNVVMITSTVDYGAVGSFNWDDNGLIYDDDGLITGVRQPFRFSVNPETPNDHVIPFLVTMQVDNGFDPADPNAPYVFQDRFYLVVQKGRVLPRVISEDMILTADDYWIIPDQTLIESGVSVTITEGTQVQFWSGDPADPYFDLGTALLQVEGSLLAQGTYTLPVELFNTGMIPGAAVNIYEEDGVADLNYVRILNPIIDITRIDHGDVNQELYYRVMYRQPGINRFTDEFAELRVYDMSSTRIANLTPVYMKSGYRNPIDTCLVQKCTWDLPSEAHNSVYLNNILKGSTISQIRTSGWQVDTLGSLHTAFLGEANGSSYYVLQKPYRNVWSKNYLQIANEYAALLGGHVATINDIEENSFIGDRLSTYYSDSSRFSQIAPDLECRSDCFRDYFFPPYYLVGMEDLDSDGIYGWIDGDPSVYENWYTNQPSGSGYCAALSTSHSYSWIVQDCDQPAVLEFPSGVTQTQLDTLRYEVLRSDLPQEWIEASSLTHNAFLFKWWDSDKDRGWTDFLSYSTRDYLQHIYYNYWDTTNTDLIDEALTDYYDDFNWAEFIYEPILEQPTAEIYPFVVDVVLSTGADSNDSTVGAEPVEFTVTFNRDMDQSVQPQISFGPDVPLTDYTIHPVDGGWQDARTWVGTFNITPVTGDGYQLIRAAGAVAADDPWLVTGDDAGRFRFEIITSGTEAMNLQATGGEGLVDLSWTQDDFDLLAGYNLYRSTSADGTYTRINAGLIPSHIKSYQDTDVTPGVPYYYRFTVEKTDGSESDFSNVAQGTPFDTIAPTLTHTPITMAAPGLALSLHADATDNVAVQSVTLYYRVQGDSSYASRAMVNTSGNTYNGTIPASYLISPGIEYYIVASDGIGTTRSGLASAPHRVTVQDEPVVTTISPMSGPESGGTTVTVSGSNFKADASVTFGAAVADNVTVISSSQITCITPVHFPSLVDVVVTNPDSQSGTLLNGFTYVSNVASMSLPATGGGQNSTVQIPINLADVSGLAAASVTVEFDPTILQATNASVGNLTPGWALAFNTPASGQARISMASRGSLVSGSGVLAYQEFDVVGDPGSTSALSITAVSLNDGSISVETADGTFDVDHVYSVGGRVTYWNGGTGVPGVQAVLDGDVLYYGLSDENGDYTVEGAASGDYVLSAQKSDDVDGISAYDASLVLRHDVGSITLSGSAYVAGDVNRNDSVSSMDAYYILQKSVGLIEQFPGGTTMWDFSPDQRSINGLSNDVTGQDFTAVLLGDPSGDWSSSVSSSSADAAPAALQLTTNADFHTIEVELTPGGSPLYSLQLTLAFDESRFKMLEPAMSSELSGWLISSNLAKPGQVLIAIAGATPLSEQATVLSIPYEVISGEGSPAVQVTRSVVDEVDITPVAPEYSNSFLPMVVE